MRTVIITLIILATLLLASTAHAGEPSVTLDINVGSYHTQTWARDQLNQRNPGVGMTYHYSRSWAVTVGGYWNSYRRPTVYGLAQWTPVQLGRAGDWHIDAGIAAGLATGYRRDEIAVRPLAGGALVRVVSPSGVSINLFAVPNAGGDKSGFLGFQLSVPM